MLNANELPFFTASMLVETQKTKTGEAKTEEEKTVKN